MDNPTLEEQPKRNGESPASNVDQSISSDTTGTNNVSEGKVEGKKKTDAKIKKKVAVKKSYSGDSEENLEHKRSLPPWVMTFADMMTLLLCFFVLVLAFSQVDAIKFKVVAEEMEKAFGVQRDILAKDIPMGTSFIKDHFAPGEVKKIKEKILQQKITQEQKSQLERIQISLLEQQQSIKSVLQAQIKSDKISVHLNKDNKIIIRIAEHGIFQPGSAIIDDSFMPALVKIQQLLKYFVGNIAVEGHTDNQPIQSFTFSSNWDLSASRAVSVAEILIEGGLIKPSSFKVIGFADTKPIAKNITKIGRTNNRRIEIVLDQPEKQIEHNTKLFHSLKGVL